jgi:PleD family two-component response regulator
VSTGITDAVPTPIRVIVAAGTGFLRDEIASAFDEDFEVVRAADARAAEEAARAGVHALVLAGDDLPNCSPEDLIQRVRVASADGYRVPVAWLAAHSEEGMLLAACQAGADDVAHWPVAEDMFRARVRSLVRAATLESTIGRAAEGGGSGAAQLRLALSTATHLINNAVAGISGRAQLAALTGGGEDAGLVSVCLTEGRKVSLILNALHRLSEAVAERDAKPEPVGAQVD